MKKELPKNWVETTLGEITIVQSGGTPARGRNAYWNGDIPWVKISDIDNDIITQTSEYITLEGVENSSTKIFPQGTILFTIFATIGKVGVLGINATTNQAIAGITPLGRVNHSYLTYSLRHFAEILQKQGKGVAQKNINLTILKTLPIPIPSLPEQQRIVAKLDTLFASLETVKERLENIPMLLKQFRQSVLSQAVKGELTEEWREGKELENEFARINTSEHRLPFCDLPRSWEFKAFKDVVKICSNLVDPNDFLDFPIIAPDNIEKDTGKLLSKPLVSEIKPISSKNHFKPNSIIYSKIRPYLSKLVVVDFEGLCSADMYPLSTDLNLQYLFHYMLTNEFVEYASTAGERTVLPKINQKSLNIIPIPIPPLTEQTEIVKRVEALFSKADRIQEKFERLKAQIDLLSQTILAKAFKGELVEQLPTDGDARELLKEIEQLKAESKKKKPQKRI